MGNDKCNIVNTLTLCRKQTVMNFLEPLLKSFLVCIMCVAGLVGCANPLPEEKLHYIGEWQSSEMGLLILADGTVAYKRLKNGGASSVNGPLKEFKGDDFIVGFSFLTTTFKVTEAPHQVDGVWTMIVDGVTLTRN